MYNTRSGRLASRTEPRVQHPPLTVDGVLSMTMKDLRIQCLWLEIPAQGLDKSAIQRRLLQHLVARATSTPARPTVAPPVYVEQEPDPIESGHEGPDIAAGGLDNLLTVDPDPVAPALDFQQYTMPSPPHQGNSVQQPVVAQPPDLAEQSSEVIHFRQVPALQTEARPPGLSRTIPQFTDISPAELQLQLKRLVRA